MHVYNEDDMLFQKENCKLYRGPYYIGYRNSSFFLPLFEDASTLICLCFQILSVICLICAGAGANLSCDYTYGSNYGFYEFVAGTVLLTYFIDYIIFAISIDEQWCMKFIPWLLWVSPIFCYHWRIQDRGWVMGAAHTFES